MNFFEAIGLGILQGFTEFFPISSSGHLLLAEHFLGLDVENLKAFDVVLHAGTLAALVGLFWDEWFSILKFGKSGRQLFGKLVVATIPAAAVGLIFGEKIDALTRGENGIFWVLGFFIFVAAFLLAAEFFGRQNSKIVGWRRVVAMGFAQAAALFPGVSRSGSTIAVGMLTGLTRSAAAKFSFLMLTPATAGAVVLISKKIVDGEMSLPPLDVTLIGFAASAVASFAFAKLLLAFVKKYSLAWFAIYLVLAAVVIFWLEIK